MNRFYSGFATLAICAVSIVITGAGPDKPVPPMATRQPATVALGGQVVSDDYWWLRKKSDPKVIDYLKAENTYTDAKLQPIAALQDNLYHEALVRIHETDESVPYKLGDWWYSVQTIQGKQYPVYLRRKGSPAAKPVVIADVNELAAGHRFFSFEDGPETLDGNLQAFMTDVTGNRQYLLQIKDLRTNELLPDKIPLVDGCAWMNDGQSIYYVREDDSKRACRLYRHVLGTAVDKDDLIYAEKDDQFSIGVSLTRDDKWIICSSASKDQSEIRVLPADHVAEPVLIEPRRAKLIYDVDHRKGRFYINTNDTNSNFRIVTAPDSAPGAANWSELVPADSAATIGRYDLFAHHMVVSERHEGLPQLAIVSLPDGDGDPAAKGPLKLKFISFPEPDFSVSIGANMEFKSTGDTI